MREIVIIGGGPAGIEAAKTAAQAGSHVTLVHDAPLGGRSGWHSLLPSKVWLTTADTLGLLKEPETLGLSLDGMDLDVDAVKARIAQVKQTWNAQQEAELHALKINLMQGVAAFVAPDAMDVTDANGKKGATLQADAFLVTTGSVPRFPPHLKPDGQRVWAPRFASQWDTLPQSIVVIGAGATGCEFAYLFNRCGVRVTWIVDEFGVLPQLHPDAGRGLSHALVRQGVHMVQGQMVERIERSDTGVTAVLMDGARYTAEGAFVAVGRMPDWNRLNLDAAGLPAPTGVIARDEYGRAKENPRIYLVGDADGGWMVANKALAQARIAARHASGKETRPYAAQEIILATYTDPQAAQVGVVQGHADAATVRVPFHAGLKTHLIPEADGFLQLHYRPDRRHLLGAVAVGPHAAEALAPVALGLKLQASLDDLAEIYAAHPTYSELAFMAARTA